MIGSAKPNATEQAAVPHHLIDELPFPVAEQYALLFWTKLLDVKRSFNFLVAFYHLVAFRLFGSGVGGGALVNLSARQVEVNEIF